MKKSVRILAVALLAVMLCAVLASCGGLSGTYRSAEALGSYTQYTFSGSKVTFDTYALGSLVTSQEGKYKVDGANITFTFKNDEGEAIESTQAFEQDKDAGTVKIGLITYTKK